MRVEMELYRLGPKGKEFKTDSYIGETTEIENWEGKLHSTQFQIIHGDEVFVVLATILLDGAYDVDARKTDAPMATS
jgi:hypothetical protein